MNRLGKMMVAFSLVGAGLTAYTMMNNKNKKKAKEFVNKIAKESNFNT